MSGYKYETNMRAYEACPPSTCTPATGEAYRICHNPFQPKDFLPPAQRRIPPNDKRCSEWGLSLYKSESEAVAAFRALDTSPLKNIRKRLGDHIAVGTLQRAFGTTTPANGHGHFDLYEYLGVQLQPVFKVVKSL